MCRPKRVKNRLKEYYSSERIRIERQRKALIAIGVTPAETVEILKRTTCEICGEEPEAPKRLYVDHCHDSKKFRGMVCHACNNGLGFFNDDVERMKAAISYLIDK